MIKTFEYRLYPTRVQERNLNETLETCRHWYNQCLAERKDAYQLRGEGSGETSRASAERPAEPSVSKFAQLAKVKDIKKSNPYAANIHSHILQVVVSDLDKAFQAFFRRVKAGETPGYPRFKGRNRFHSFGLKEYGNGFKLDGRRLKISGIGRVAVRWHREIEGHVKTLRIKCKASKWFACFACEVKSQPLPATGVDVGVDVGIHHLIATSDGETIENPQWYRVEQAKLRVLQRSVTRKAKGGSNRGKAVLRLQCQHELIANRRADFLKKLACGLVERYDRIALEDLRITNMVRNHHLSKSILDGG